MPAPTKIAPLSRDPIARRVAEYVNAHFDGNLSAACAAIGCTHEQLRRVAMGISKINVHLIRLLAEHSGKSVDWWLTGE